MKKLFLSLVLLAGLSLKAHASTDVNVVGSSWTWSGVICTSGTVVRVDNFYHGLSTGIITSQRIGLVFQNQDSTNAVWLGYDANLSTDTTNVAHGQNIGFKLKANDITFIGALRSVQIYCQSADAATTGVWLNTQTVFKE